MSSVAAADESDLPHWKPGKTTIAKLDFAFRNAGLWKGSPPDTGKYSRYYAGVTIKGRRMVRAEFAMPVYVNVVCRRTSAGDALECDQAHVGSPKPRVYFVPEDKFPSLFDGGCSVVNMLYDVDADRLVSIACNGVA